MVEVENGCCPETRTLSARAKEEASVVAVGSCASENAVTFFFFRPLLPPLDDDEEDVDLLLPFFPSPPFVVFPLSKSTSSCVNNGDEDWLDLG